MEEPRLCAIEFEVLVNPEHLQTAMSPSIENTESISEGKYLNIRIQASLVKLYLDLEVHLLDHTMSPPKELLQMSTLPDSTAEMKKGFSLSHRLRDHSYVSTVHRKHGSTPCPWL